MVSNVETPPDGVPGQGIVRRPWYLVAGRITSTPPLAGKKGWSVMWHELEKRVGELMSAGLYLEDCSPYMSALSRLQVGSCPTAGCPGYLAASAPFVGVDGIVGNCPECGALIDIRPAGITKIRRRLEERLRRSPSDVLILASILGVKMTE